MTEPTPIPADAESPGPTSHYEMASAHVARRQDHAAMAQTNVLAREAHRTAVAQVHATLALADALSAAMEAIRELQASRTWGLDFELSSATATGEPDDAMAVADAVRPDPDAGTVYVPVYRGAMRDDARDRRPTPEARA